MRHIGWILLLLVVLTDCSSLNFPTNSKIRIKGSDTMIILLQQLAKEYMRTHPGVSVYTEGGGTGSGIKALIKGEVEICSASRPLRPNEVQGLAAKYGAVGVSFLVAKDALSIYLHPENPVKNLTINQLRNIFSGELRNWKGVGGGD
ncbi:MAG: phosphate ABC transporter substrate-binding protein, partial [Calditrichae bacterium]|nr:phosphate ABC transporter substrate-binding protein [Calditrichia bacterium]